MIATGTTDTIAPPAPPELPEGDDEQPLLACVPQDPTLWHRVGLMHSQMSVIAGTTCTPAAGSIDGECVSCDCKIWIGPTQQQHIGLPTLCLVCALALAVEGAEVTRLGTDGIPRPGVNFEAP